MSFPISLAHQSDDESESDVRGLGYGSTNKLQPDDGAYLKDCEFIFQEKIDGSNALYFQPDTPESNQLQITCRGKLKSASDKLFGPMYAALAPICSELPNDKVFCTEYVPKLRSGQIAYKELPKRLNVVWDIRDYKTGFYCTPEEVKTICEKYDLTYTPIIYHYKPNTGQTFINPFEFAQRFLEKMNNPSFQPKTDWEKNYLPEYEPLLGGDMIEGVVLKVLKFAPPPEGHKYCPVSRVNKIVYTEFKERNSMKKVKPVKEPKVAQTFEQMMHEAGKVYDTFPRFEKAVQHLREQSSDKHVLTCLKEHQWNDPLLVQALEEELAKDLCKEKKDSLLSMIFYSQATDLVCLAASNRSFLEDWVNKNERDYDSNKLYEEIRNQKNPLFAHVPGSLMKKEVIMLGLQYARPSFFDEAITSKGKDNNLSTMQRQLREHLRNNYKETLSQQLFDILSVHVFQGARQSLPKFLQQRLVEEFEEKVSIGT